MGYVRDQLRFQPLGAHLLLHGLLHPVGDGIEVFRVALELPEHMRRVDLTGERAGGELFSAVAELFHVDNGQHEHSCEDRPAQKPPQEKRAGAAGDHDEDHLDEAHGGPDQPGLPVEREILSQIAQAAQKPAEKASELPQDPENDGVFVPAARLAACSKAHQEGQHKKHKENNADRDGCGGREDRPVDAGGEIKAEGDVEAAQRGPDQQEKVQRDAVEPRQVDSLRFCAVTGAAHQKHEVCDGKQREQDAEDDHGIPARDQPVQQLVFLPDPVVDVQRSAGVADKRILRPVKFGVADPQRV